MTRNDNLRSIRGDLFVDPVAASPRLRIGDAARTRSGARATSARSTLLINVIEGAREIGTGPNRPFATTHGYRIAEENVRRDLAWPRPRGELDRLWDEWAPFALDYEIVSWTKGTPDEFVDARAHLSSIMPTETPHVDLDVEAEHWDAARVRHHEATTRSDGSRPPRRRSATPRFG